MSTPRYLTLGQAARIIEARHPGSTISMWQMRRLYHRRLLPDPPRCGQYRLVLTDEVDAIEAALVQAGYLRPDAAEVTA